MYIIMKILKVRDVFLKNVVQLYEIDLGILMDKNITQADHSADLLGKFRRYYILSSQLIDDVRIVFNLVVTNLSEDMIPNVNNNLYG